MRHRAPQSKEVLLKRLRRFFEEVPEERQPVVSFLQSIKGAENIYLFGGLIREICLHGVTPFKSDVDIIVQVQDQEAFDDYIQQYDFDKNKFGGYRVQVSRWMIDIWDFKRTWAFAKGHVHPKGVGSLLKTTFFDWDAVVYDYKKDRLYCDDQYLSKIQKGVLDLNLKNNPNTQGAFVRSLRFVTKERVRTGPGLSEFIVSHLNQTRDDEILEYERQNFQSKSLTADTLTKIRNRAKAWDGEEVFLWLNDKQLKLFDDCDG